MSDIITPKHKSRSLEWEDDVKMTVMYSPFRDRNLNPKSWDQKVKFWSETILSDCSQENQGIIETDVLREKYRRKGRSPACLATVLQQMISNGEIVKLSDLQNNKTSNSWVSWGYNKLVKQPIGWGWTMLPWQQKQDKPIEEAYVIIDVIKNKAENLLEMRRRLCQDEAVNIIDYNDLRDQHRDMCASDIEFGLVMKHLLDTKQVVIQESEGNTKLVKFIEKKANQKPVKIDEQDVHLHRIQKAQSITKTQVEALSKEVLRLGAEAVNYKKQGLMKLAMSCMRKRRLALTRLDHLTGSLDTLEDIVYRIKQAENNEMVLRAIEGGSSVLKEITGKTTVEDVANVMDNLADVTQTQEEIMAEMSVNYTGVEEPSQSELEEELAGILLEDTPTDMPTAVSLDKSDTASFSLDKSDTASFSLDKSDLDLEKELAEILADNGSPVKSKSVERSHVNKMASLNDMLDDLQLPDVPGHSPSSRLPEKKQALTS